MSLTKRWREADCLSQSVLFPRCARARTAPANRLPQLERWAEQTMTRNQNYSMDGWKIEIKLNVHMYCHELWVQKGKLEYSIPCEDLPGENSIGIWFESGKILDQHVTEISQVLPHLKSLIIRDVRIYFNNQLINSSREKWQSAQQSDASETMA